MENRIVVAVKGLISYNGKVLIIKRAGKDEVDADVWEGVGGKIEFGEELEAALRREVKEEVGLDIKVDKLLFATTFKTDPARQVVVLSYKCSTNSDKVILSEEHSDYKWVSKEEFRSKVYDPIISDMDKYDVFHSVFES